MYAKMFDQIFDSSIADDVDLRHFFMDMIVLADSDGVVDMTPSAIAARTRIPLDKVRAHLEALERPDNESRTQEHDGRRIQRLDDHRSWGWVILNYDRFRRICTADQKKAKTRERVRRFRAKASQSAPIQNDHKSVTVTQRNACNATQKQKQKQREDTDTTATNTKDNAAVAASGASLKKPKNFKCGYDPHAAWDEIYHRELHKVWYWLPIHHRPIWDLAKSMVEKEFRFTLQTYFRSEDPYIIKTGFSPSNLMRNLAAYSPPRRAKPAQISEPDTNHANIDNPEDSDAKLLGDDGPIPIRPRPGANGTAAAQPGS